MAPEENKTGRTLDLAAAAGTRLLAPEMKMYNRSGRAPTTPGCLLETTVRRDAGWIHALASRRFSDILLGVFVFVLSCVVLFVVSNSADNDLWGHLSAGRLISETLDVPRRDPFSFSAPGAPWVSHEWLFQIAVYFLFSSFGTKGIVLLRWGLVAATLAFVYGLIRRQSDDGPVRAVAFLVTSVALYFGFRYRPQLFTFAGCALILFAYDRPYRDDDLLQRALPWVLIPWSWFHGGFLAGMTLLLLIGLGEALKERWFPPATISPGQRRRLFLSTLAATVLTCLNPYGISLWRRLHLTLTSAMPAKFIPEWQSFATTEIGLLYAIVVSHIMIAAVSFAASSRKTNVTRWLLVAAGLLASMRAVRHIPLAALVLAAPLTEFLDATAKRVFGRPRHPEGSGAGIFYFAFNTVAAASIGLLLYWGVFAAPRLRETPLGSIRMQGERDFNADIYPPSAVFPNGAVRFIKKNGIGGRIWNFYRIGAYLTWHLFPRCKTLADFRAENIFDENSFSAYKRVGDGTAGWQRTLERYRPDLLLLELNIPILPALLKEGQWRIIYRDPDYVLLARDRNRFGRLMETYRRNPVPSPRPRLPWLFPG